MLKGHEFRILREPLVKEEAIQGNIATSIHIDVVFLDSLVCPPSLKADRITAGALRDEKGGVKVKPRGRDDLQRPLLPKRLSRPRFLWTSAS